MATHIYETGACCEGNKCLHRDGELRPSHTCPRCEKIVHHKCGVMCVETDKITCNTCDEIYNRVANSVVPIRNHDDVTQNEHGALLPLTGAKVLDTMEVSITPMNDEFTTITDSVKSCEYKIIPKDYFIMKSQRINALMKRDDPHWETLKNKVQVHIDSELKDRMLKEAQNVGLHFGKVNRKFLVENFTEIGKSWKTDGSVENALKINQVLYGIFDASRGYEYYLEKDIMSKLKLQYSDEIKGRGSIAMMVIRRKADLAKCVMKRAAMTHDTKITKQRTSEQAKIEGIRKPKQKYSFQIKSMDGNKWYNKDGSDYSEQKCVITETSQEQELKRKIKDLEMQLDNRVKVHIIFCITFSYSIICNHLFTACIILYVGRKQTRKRMGEEVS